MYPLVNWPIPFGAAQLTPSRAALRVRAEHEYTVAPLATPASTAQVLAHDMLDYAAVDLFVRRARAVRPAFEITEMALNNRGEMARLLGDDERAAALLRESVDLRRELGDKMGLEWSLADLAHVARQQGDAERALILYEEAMTYCQAVGAKLGAAVCLEGMAAALFLRGEVERTQQLYEEADALRLVINAPMAPVDLNDHDPIKSALRAMLGEQDGVQGAQKE